MEQSGVEFVISGLSSFIDGMNRAQGSVKSLGGVMKAFEKVADIGGAITTLGLAISALAPQIGPIIAVVGLLISALAKFGQMIGGVVGKAIDGFAQTLKGLYSVFLSLIRPITDFASRILDAINPVRMLTDLLNRVLYIGLGILTADVFRGIIRGVRDLAQEAFDAATSFQLLNIRLQSFAARDIIEAMDEQQQAAIDYAAVFRQVESAVKDAADWIVTTAAITPFTIESITNIYALARSYSFTADAAKGLVTTIGNFSAAMGLSDTEMKRIIVNLGQMQQLGKITQRELNDLARGAFVPVNQILEQMAKNLDITREELVSFMQDGKVGVNEFITAFTQVVARDFPDAMRKMFETIPGIVSGLHDITQALFGFRVLGPTMDLLAKRLADIFIDILQDPRLFQMVDELGDALLKLVEGVWPDDISGKSIMDAIFDGFQKLKGVVGFLLRGEWQNALKALGVPQWVITSVENLQGAFDNLKKFWDQNGEDLIAIVERVMKSLGFDKLSPDESFPKVTDKIKEFTQWMIDNGPKIVETVDKVAKSIEHFATVTMPLLMGSFSGNASLESLGPLDKLALTLNALAKIGSALMDTIGQSLSRLGLAMEGAGVGSSLLDNSLKLLVGTFSIFAGLIAGTVNSIVNVLLTVRRGFDQVVLGVKMFILGFENLFSGDIVGGFSEITTGIQLAITGLITYLSTPLAAVAGFVEGFLEYFRNLSDELVGNSIVPDMMDDILDTIATGLADATAAVAEGVGGIVDAILAWNPKVADALREIAKTFYTRAQGWVEQAAKAVESMVNRLVEAIKTLIRSAQAAITAIVIPVMWGNPGPLPRFGVSSGVSFGGGGGGGGGGGTCFVAGTMIAMSDFSQKPIEDVVVGDLVISRDMITGQDFSAPVAEVIHHAKEEMQGYLNINDGLIFVTPEHPLYVANLKKWVGAGALARGDLLVRRDRKIQAVYSSIGVAEQVPVYNLHIGHESHNYFANDVLVHNVETNQKASGGAVSGGQSYLVGEQRPEIFAPKSNGHIFPSIEAAVEGAVGKMSAAFTKAISTQVSSMAQMAVPMGAGGNTTNYNVEVNANYQNPQSPVTISHDLDAILAKTRL